MTAKKIIAPSRFSIQILVLSIGICSCSSGRKCSYDADITITNIPIFDSIKIGLADAGLYQPTGKDVKVNDSLIQFTPHLDAYGCGSTTESLYKPESLFIEITYQNSVKLMKCGIKRLKIQRNGEFLGAVDAGTMCGNYIRQ